MPGQPGAAKTPLRDEAVTYHVTSPAPTESRSHLQRADVVLNSRAIPADRSSASPAVFITDNSASRYEVFDTQSYEVSRQFLAGSLMVQFNTAYQ